MSGKFDWDEIQDLIYKCPRCGYIMKGEELIMRNRIVCPKCGYHVIVKIASPKVRRVKAI